VRRSRAAWAVAALAAATLAGGCGGGDSDATPTGPTSSQGTSTSAAKKNAVELDDARGDTKPAQLDIVKATLGVDRAKSELTVRIDLAAAPKAGSYSAMLACGLYMWEVGQTVAGSRHTSYVRDHVGAVPETRAEGAVDGRTVTVTAPLSAVNACGQGGFGFQVIADGATGMDTAPEPGTGVTPELAQFPRVT
jgi:hypothetical protein